MLTLAPPPPLVARVALRAPTLRERWRGLRAGLRDRSWWHAQWHVALGMLLCDFFVVGYTARCPCCARCWCSACEPIFHACPSGGIVFFRRTA